MAPTHAETLVARPFSRSWRTLWSVELRGAPPSARAPACSAFDFGRRVEPLPQPSPTANAAHGAVSPSAHRPRRVGHFVLPSRPPEGRGEGGWSAPRAAVGGSSRRRRCRVPLDCRSPHRLHALTSTPASSTHHHHCGTPTDPQSRPVHESHARDRDHARRRPARPRGAGVRGGPARARPADAPQQRGPAAPAALRSVQLAGA